MRLTSSLTALLLLAGCDAGGSTDLLLTSTGVAGTTATSDGNDGSNATGGATTPKKEDFKLLFRDDFETFDATRWQLMTHSWDGNLALFSTSAAVIDEGTMRISLTPAPEGTIDSSGKAKSFLGAEVRSLDTLTYGRVRARAKLAAGSAVVSSIVTIYTPWPADNWNELDIEHLGFAPSDVQLNSMVYLGPTLTPPVATSVVPTADPLIEPLGFDPSADFHVYTIEWTPTSARFSIDDTLLREWTTHIDLMTLPQNVLLTIWASGSPGWAGAVTEDTGKASAVYDWVELYELQP